ncbi:MAG: branched-chain amino acid transport system permease protein [Rhodospirillales bacterium]|nr:branched-chain amino acid transport system permease protein [Rhodospirillales bacterium]
MRTLFVVIGCTRIGITFRAVWTSPLASRVCGINLHAFQGLAWGAAATLGVIASLLIIPSTFLSSTTVAAFMLQSFAAAVLGGFSSLPGSIIGGLIVGVAMNLFSFFVTSELSSTFLLILILILVALNVIAGVSIDLQRYYLPLLALGLVVVLLARFRRSRQGLVLLTARDHPARRRPSAFQRLRTARIFRHASFAISATVASIAGALLAFATSTVSPNSFTLSTSIYLLVGTVIGFGSLGMVAA